MYQQGITRRHRTAFVIAIDLSGSMAEPVMIGERKATKAAWVCETANRLIFELIERARRSDGVHDYYDLAVIGYSGEGVRPLLSEEWFLGIDRVAALPHQKATTYERRMAPDGHPLLLKMEYPAWITPETQGQTPLYEALCEIYGHLKEWIADPRHRESFPPIVFNITDGEATDGFPEELQRVSDEIRDLATADGKVLLINIHIAPDSAERTLFFPCREEQLHPNRYAALLYDCSSEMPSCFDEAIRAIKGPAALPPFRGVSFNASAAELVAMLDIGTISVKTE